MHADHYQYVIMFLSNRVFFSVCNQNNGFLVTLKETKANCKRACTLNYDEGRFFYKLFMRKMYDTNHSNKIQHTLLWLIMFIILLKILLIYTYLFVGFYFSYGENLIYTLIRFRKVQILLTTEQIAPIIFFYEPTYFLPLF